MVKNIFDYRMSYMFYHYYCYYLDLCFDSLFLQCFEDGDEWIHDKLSPRATKMASVEGVAELQTGAICAEVKTLSAKLELFQSGFKSYKVRLLFGTEFPKWCGLEKEVGQPK